MAKKTCTPIKQFGGVCTVANPHWIRVGHTYVFNIQGMMMKYHEYNIIYFCIKNCKSPAEL